MKEVNPKVRMVEFIMSTIMSTIRLMVIVIFRQVDILMEHSPGPQLEEEHFLVKKSFALEKNIYFHIPAYRIEGIDNEFK